MEGKESTNSETLISDTDTDTDTDNVTDQHLNGQNFQVEEEEEEEEDVGMAEESKQQQQQQQQQLSLDQKEIVRALEVVERDSLAIAQSFTSLFGSLRHALSKVTSRSVDHMHCFSDAAGRVQECALDAASKGNRYINSCLRLNEEIKGMESLAGQLKALKRNVDAMDSAVNRLHRLP